MSDLSSAIESVNRALIQGTPEWHAERAGQILASVCAVWERLHPYTTPDKELRASVRQLIDNRTDESAPPEVVINDAMKHGMETESVAKSFYEDLKGVRVSSTGSVAHPEYSFLRGSPDGLIGLSGGLEIKCPYYATEPYSVFDKKRVMYLWQCYAIMEICDLEWIDFLCYIDENRYLIERVDRRNGFLEEKVSGKFLPNPRPQTVRRIDLWQSWFNHIQDEFQDGAKRVPYIKPIKPEPLVISDDKDLDELDQNVRKIDHIEGGISEQLQQVATLRSRNDEIKKVLADRYNQSITNSLITIDVINKKAPIDYKKAFDFIGGEQLLLEKGSNMENFRKTTNTRQVSIKTPKEKE